MIWRTLVTVVAVNFFSLFVFVGLATLQYDSILSGLTRERLVVLADTVRGPFQTVADLGIPIGSVRNADAVLAQARMSDESIVAIHAISPEGEIVRTTASQAAPRANADVLEAGDLAGVGATWHLETDDSFLVGANIADASGSKAGSVLIEYSKRESNIQVQAMEARLVLLAVAVLLATTLIGLVILRLVLSEHVRIFDGILSSFDRFERKFWRGIKTQTDPDPNIGGLGLNTSDFKKLMESSEHQYQRAKATLVPPESIAPPR